MTREEIEKEIKTLNHSLSHYKTLVVTHKGLVSRYETQVTLYEAKIDAVKNLLAE